MRLLPDWRLPPIELYALMPARMLPAKTRALVDFFAGRLADGEAWRPRGD